jgi:hypothetical protein
MYKNSTGYVPGEWSEGKTIFEWDGLTLSTIPYSEMILVSHEDGDGPDATIAITPAELYNLVTQAAHGTHCSPFPDEPGAYVSGKRWGKKNMTGAEHAEG